MSNPTVVTRFAPSPTGYLHVGGARTALFNWLLARHTGGKFLLRIEDTDLARSTEQAVHQLVEDLQWLGLKWDNAELVYQSKRLPIYNALIEKLMERGLAYKAYETSEELDAQRKQAERAKRQFRYRRPALSAEQIKQYEAEGRPHVVRFVMQPKEYRFDDAVLGPNQGFGVGEVQDFVIRKSDGMPTYHFGVVVDDAEMGITHVLRGQEHLLNTCNHIALQEALGYPRPIYAHLSVILAPETRAKLSKRDRDQKIRKRVGEVMRSAKRPLADIATDAGIAEARLGEWLGDEKKQLDLSEQPKVMKAVGLREADLPEIMVHDFRKNGYLPEVLNNFLALLGWSPGGDRERMSIDELVKLFSLDGVGRSNSMFARDKLLAFNTEAGVASSPPRMLAAMRDYLSVNPDSPLNIATDGELEKVLKMNHGFHILREAEEKSRFLFTPDEKIEYQADAIDKVLKKNEGQGAAALRDVKATLEDISDWTTTSLETAVKAYCEQKQLGLGKVAQPIRVAVSGSAISPPIFETLEFLGKARTLARIDRCLAGM
ncbi:MAG TPA: glutamate--tRNA ligase [Tepidisphaeraceae bacterium]|jgi:glutamyl-tRNA synthetase|nr:glutamate--tRNA ligase [Tepidisphaeraceae bacterium]